MADAVNALLFSIKLEREKGTAGRAGCREDAVVHWLGDCDVKLKFGVYKATKLRHAPRLATRSENELTIPVMAGACLLSACCLLVVCSLLAWCLLGCYLFAVCSLVACWLLALSVVAVIAAISVVVVDAIAVVAAISVVV